MNWRWRRCSTTLKPFTATICKMKTLFKDGTRQWSVRRDTILCACFFYAVPVIEKSFAYKHYLSQLNQQLFEKWYTIWQFRCYILWHFYNTSLFIYRSAALEHISLKCSLHPFWLGTWYFQKYRNIFKLAVQFLSYMMFTKSKSILHFSLPFLVRFTDAFWSSLL